ncbi:ABC transporter substrate-binding protein [Pelagibacteraceae bacterium]|nr:ABC transporter substrate-binding protein [Pelagibacteraceae bacterium]
MKIKLIIFFFIIFISKNLYSDETSDWLKREIDIILEAYKNQSLSNENRFLLIEKTINNNFAGTGIAKFVAGEAWKKSDKNTKKIYIDNFKRHLALNIASMMQGYSDQKYELTKSKYDNKNQVTLVDMEIFSDTGSVIVTWRVKESKDRFYVIDLIVADISLVVTKRSEFNSMLKKVDNDLSKFNEVLSDQNEISYLKIIE